MSFDNWINRPLNMICGTCMFYVPKFNIIELAKEDSLPVTKIGRCRRHAPTLNGFPVIFKDDWCGDHKLDENKIS